MSKEFKVGILALISFSLLYLGFNFLKGNDFFSSTNSYIVKYDHIGGLTVSNPVVINGFSVGRVSKIELLQDNSNQLLITLEINNKIKITEGSKAKLVDSSLLGGKQIELEIVPGTKILEQDDEIIGFVEASMAELLEEKALPVLRNIDSTVVYLNTVLKDFQGLGGKVHNVMEEADKASKQLNALLAKNSTSITETVASTAKITKQLNEQLETQIKPLLVKFNGIAQNLKDAEMAATVAKANTLVASLQKTIDGVNSSQGTMGKLLKDDSLYINMNQSIKDLDQLFIDLKEHPKRYVQFSVFGKKDKTKK